MNDNAANVRASGLLLGIASLPGKYGIGKMGNDARKFVDFLKASGQRYWQILPLSPTSYGDSPYQSYSCNAGNPYFIDFETLERDGLLDKSDYENVEYTDNPSYINYGMLYNTVYKTLRKAYKRFKPDSGLKAFVEKNSDWINDYALFMALKGENEGKPWYEWDKPLMMAEASALSNAKKRLGDEIGFYVFLQYEFYKQWFALKKYANESGVEIIGDMPIYCAYDSVEVWLHPELFQLDENKKPACVAGCPPDAYAAEGQLWGNPLYDWKGMQANGYNWWVKRIAFETDIYDILRIDHFRGFAAYYSIPYKDKTAANGRWRKGPGMELFNSANYWLGRKRIVAEDLGFVTEDVKELLKASGYPGMKVLQFAFDPNASSAYLPCNYDTRNCIVYTSTHDSDTAKGWADGLSGKEFDFCLRYAGIKDREQIPDALLRLAWASVANIAIAQPQDLLGYGNEARINVPATLGLNWRWRLSDSDLSPALSKKLRTLTETYNRICRAPVAACAKK